MAQSLSSVLVHLVFSTKNRERILDQPIRGELFSYLAGALNGFKCNVLEVGGESDHVHALFALTRTMAISDVVMHLKITSSKWLKTKSPLFNNFHWQSGFGIFSVNFSNAEAARRYIQRQEEHHRTMTFQEEFRKFLTDHKIDYDERYVWD